TFACVNLLLPERFTGDAGPSATHIWHSVYDERCFSDQDYSLTAHTPLLQPPV
ncbi:hypothetical protein HK405_000480, partial [Cladochytrium tenue]